MPPSNPWRRLYGALSKWEGAAERMCWCQVGGGSAIRFDASQMWATREEFFGSILSKRKTVPKRGVPMRLKADRALAHARNAIQAFKDVKSIESLSTAYRGYHADFSSNTSKLISVLKELPDGAAARVGERMERIIAIMKEWLR
jgi:hypothetical protein